MTNCFPANYLPRCAPALALIKDHEDLSTAEERPNGIVQQNTCHSTTAEYYRQPEELRKFLAANNLRIKIQLHCSTGRIRFSLPPLRHSPVLDTVVSPAVLDTDLNNAINLVIMRWCIMTELTTTRTKVNGKLMWENHFGFADAQDACAIIYKLRNR